MAGVAMAGDGDTTSKCRAARRRRIEMRRVAAVAGDATSPRGAGRPREAEAVEREGGEKRARTAGTDPPPPPVLSSSSTSSSTYSVSSSGGGEASASALALAVASTSASAPAPASVVAFGSVAISGRTREMEDAVSVRPGFFRRPGVSPIHFFAVFDGHGGSHVSALCKERMHVLMAEELGRAAGTEELEGWWRAAVERSFGRMDELALRACACGRVEDPPCGCERSGIESDIVGSTAVVAVLSQERVLVANCGDSRAVLSRGGHSVPLSSDHKPDRPDELARIEAAGGRVIYLNGPRVHGILAMSRALGDKYLKPVVISEPEIRIIERTPEDECLIIASDGLWDVLSNDMACDVARRCLAEGNPVRVAEDLSGVGIENSSSVEGEEQASDARCSLAAALLARLALGRKSKDNISVIVIDLRRG